MQPLVTAEFNNVVELYTIDGQTDSNCGDVTFLNNGVAPVTINGVMLLQSNQSFTFGANVGETNKTQFRFVFTKDPPLQQSLLVVKKYYIPPGNRKAY